MNTKVPAWVLVVIIAFLGFAFMGGVSSRNTPQTPAKAVTGDTVVIKQDVIVGVDKASYDRLSQLLLAKDKDGIGQMYLDHEVYMWDAGTEVRVIHDGMGWYEVRKTDGSLESGFITSEILNK